MQFQNIVIGKMEAQLSYDRLLVIVSARVFHSVARFQKGNRQF